MSDSTSWFKKNCRLNNSNGRKHLTEVQQRRAIAGTKGTYVTRIQFADGSAEQRNEDALDRHEAVYGSTSLRINRTTHQN